MIDTSKVKRLHEKAEITKSQTEHLRRKKQEKRRGRVVGADPQGNAATYTRRVQIR